MNKNRIDRMMVIQLGNKNTVVNTFLQAWREGYMEWEECLQSITYHLIEQNEKLMRELTKEELSRPMQIVISKEQFEAFKE